MLDGQGIYQKLPDDMAAQLKSEVVRIGTSGSREAFKFAERMFELHPELKNA